MLKPHREKVFSILSKHMPEYITNECVNATIFSSKHTIFDAQNP